MCSCTSLAAASRCVPSASPSCSAAINLQLLSPAGSKSAYKVSQKALDQGCPTHGPRAAWSPLDKLVRPFSLLTSLTSFFKDGKKFSRKGKFFRERQIQLRGREKSWRWTGIGGKMSFPKKGHQKIWDMRGKILWVCYEQLCGCGPFIFKNGN